MCVCVCVWCRCGGTSREETDTEMLEMSLCPCTQQPDIRSRATNVFARMTDTPVGTSDTAESISQSLQLLVLRVNYAFYYFLLKAVR